MTNSQELETARRMNLNLVVLIIEDHAYGMIRWKQTIDGFADWGLTFDNPDFFVRRSLWCPRSAGHNGIGVGASAGGSVLCRRVHLIAVPVDYSESVRVLVDELRHMQD
jgi:acetolactate synthase-1/2/3 large subunit